MSRCHLHQTYFPTILKEGLRLWCASLKEQSIGCGDFLGKYVHCIQWTSVSNTTTAAEMTDMCQTDSHFINSSSEKFPKSFCGYNLEAY